MSLAERAARFDTRCAAVAEVPLRVLEQGSGKAVDPWAQYRSVKQRIPASLTRDLAG